jgi:hypothetical protein
MSAHGNVRLTTPRCGAAMVFNRVRRGRSAVATHHRRPFGPMSSAAPDRLKRRERTMGVEKR